MMVGTLKKSIGKPDVIMFLSPESISALQNTGQMVSLYLSEVTLSEPRHRQEGRPDQTRTGKSWLLRTTHHTIAPSYHRTIVSDHSNQPLITIISSNITNSCPRKCFLSWFFWFEHENLINCLCVAEANQDFLSGGNIYIVDMTWF